MNAIAPAANAPSAGQAGRRARFLTAVEVLSVFAAILLYLWRWQYTFPRAWMPLLAVVIASHFLHRDSPRSMGLGLSGFRGSARLTFPLAAAVFTPLILYGFLARRPIPNVPTGRAFEGLAAYALWCAFQQYLTQSYFHRRLMTLVNRPWLNSILVGLLFGSAHIPNPILMVATFVAGVVFAEVFRRRPNIWPLALVQAVGGFLIGWISPAALIHGMRVGPGYFFYHLR